MRIRLGTLLEDEPNINQLIRELITDLPQMDEIRMLWEIRELKAASAPIIRSCLEKNEDPLKVQSAALRDLLLRNREAREVKVIKDLTDILPELRELLEFFIGHHQLKELAKQYGISPALQAELEGPLDNIIRALNHIIENLEPRSWGRKSPIMRIALDQQNALTNHNWKKFLDRWFEEKQFYGKLTDQLSSLGVREIIDEGVKKGGLTRREFAALIATFGLASIVIGLGLQPFFTPKERDALKRIIEQYKKEDWKFEPEAEIRLERLYGFNIIGKFTNKDLRELSGILKQRYSIEQIRHWGLRTIVIIEEKHMSKVDYCGQARKKTMTIRLFSGHIREGGTFEHELAHIRTYWFMNQKHFKLAQEWKKLGEPYNKVVYKRSSSSRGKIAKVKHYNDKEKTSASLPKFGYVRAYGGVDWMEDIATYVEAIRGGNGKDFAKKIMDNPLPYLKKLQVLEKYGFITPKEHWNIVGEVRCSVGFLNTIKDPNDRELIEKTMCGIMPEDGPTLSELNQMEEMGEQ